MSLFEKRIPFKPFEYPEYYNEGWLRQAQAFWLHTEIPMSSDVKDWNEKLTDSEKHLVGNILLGFAQTECAVSDYWTNQVTKWFPKHEIIMMAMMFGSQETIHASAYSYLNDTLGLDDFEGFMREPAIADRVDKLVNTMNDYTHDDLIKSKEARIDVAKSLAIFSAFTEGVALYSSFAVLYSFQMRNMLKGIGQQMKWSVRDEALHSKMGCTLFRHMCQEFPELKDQAYDKIKDAALLTLEMEQKFIDKVFEQGDLENLTAYDLKHFMHQRINEKMVELGYEPIVAYDVSAASRLEWFNHLTSGVEHADFFAIRPTAYSKANEGEDWEDLF